MLSVVEGCQLCVLSNKSVGPRTKSTVPPHALSQVAFLPPHALGQSSKYSFNPIVYTRSSNLCE